VGRKTIPTLVTILSVILKHTSQSIFNYNGTTKQTQLQALDIVNVNQTTAGYGEDLPVFFADGEGIEYAIDGVTGDYHVCYSEKWDKEKGTTVKLEVIKLDELRATCTVVCVNEEQLKNAYEREVARCSDYAKTVEKSGGDCIVRMIGFSGGPSRCQNLFEVINTKTEKKEQYNWYGQNTSQWVYAGCIAVSEDGYVSTHH
jgi:hypothetical protein